MKHLNIKISSLFILSLLIGCTTKPSVSPSQNNALNNITNPNTTKKNGYMQNSLNSWLKNDWEPTIEATKKEKTQEKNPIIVEKNLLIEEDKKVKEKNESFTLQKYVDKASAYMKAHPTDESKTHYKKIESLPAIGK